MTTNWKQFVRSITNLALPLTPAKLLLTGYTLAIEKSYEELEATRHAGVVHFLSHDMPSTIVRVSFEITRHYPDADWQGAELIVQLSDDPPTEWHFDGYVFQGRPYCVPQVQGNVIRKLRQYVLEFIVEQLSVPSETLRNLRMFATTNNHLEALEQAIGHVFGLQVNLVVRGSAEGDQYILCCERPGSEVRFEVPLTDSLLRKYIAPQLGLSQPA